MTTTTKEIKLWPVTEQTETEICSNAAITVPWQGHRLTVSDWRTMHNSAILQRDSTKVSELMKAYKLALQSSGYYYDTKGIGNVLLVQVTDGHYEIVDQLPITAAGNPPKTKGSKKAAVKVAPASTKDPVKQLEDAPDIDEVALRSAMKKLDTLIGLDEIKQRVSDLVDMIRVQQMREKAGLPVVGNSYHMVFTGNPGTGKTTVGRVLGEIFRAMGVLSEGHLIETEASGLIDKYVGATALKTEEKINEAMGGVLLIDEAYALDTKSGQGDGYGPEAMAKLLKRMEDDRHNLIVIMAGYTEEMEDLLKSNPGLDSRFKTVIEFPDYSDEELLAIYKMMNREYKFRLGKGTADKIQTTLAVTRANEDHFGNGRAVRNLFEESVIKQARRLAKTKAKDMTPAKLSMLLPHDIPDQIHYREEKENEQKAI